MPKTPPPLLGFNNNVKHRGRIFHIQTEDSGVKRPHVITHLFADGGRIVKSKKTTYAEHVGEAEMNPLVRKVMKEQHKAMFIALRGGDFDDLIEEICGPHPLPATPLPAKLQAAKDRAEKAAREKEAATAAAASPSSSEEAAPQPKSRRSLSNPALRRVTPPVRPALASQELDIDVEKQLADPPVPAGATPVHGTPIAAAKADAEVADRASARPSRYAPSRPAAIFDSRPDEASIFGGGISEQSLDDVILSYIAEDLEDE